MSTNTANPAIPQRITGVLSPVVTPFKRDLSPDPVRYVRHCKWLLSQGCAGLARPAQPCDSSHLQCRT